MKIAVIGSGGVGGTLARRLAGVGHEIIIGARNPQSDSVRAVLDQVPAGASLTVASIVEAVAAADVVLLATPWDVTEATVRAAGDLTGKLVIDCTNPLAADLSLALGHTTSGGELVAQAAAGARVVKAFNTTGYGNMESPAYGDARAAMFVCGDDEAARATTLTLVEEIGFEGVDCGPLANARLLEPVAALWIWLAYAGGQGRDFAFGLLRR